MSQPEETPKTKDPKSAESQITVDRDRGSPGIEEALAAGDMEKADTGGGSRLEQMQNADESNRAGSDRDRRGSTIKPSPREVGLPSGVERRSDEL